MVCIYNVLFACMLQFPLVLDMEPYTADGMAWREALVQSSQEIENGIPSVVLDSVTDDQQTDDSLGGSVANKKADVMASSSQKQPHGSSSSHCGLHITSAINMPHINYELIGVVVHSGQANAGHYYSFIKDRRYLCLF